MGPEKSSRIISRPNKLHSNVFYLLDAWSPPAVRQCQFGSAHLGIPQLPSLCLSKASKEQPLVVDHKSQALNLHPKHLA